MPRKVDAVPIARMLCLTPGCCERVPVYQAKNHYLYTRCSQCGCEQSIDAARQVAVWQRMEPIEGQLDAKGVPVLIHRPRNVPESAGAIGGALAGTAPAVTVIEPEEPAAVPAQKPVQPVAPEAVESVPAKPEKPAEKAGAEPVHVPTAPAAAVPVPAPKGTGTGSGFWWFFGTLAAITAAGVAYAQSNSGERAQA